MTAECLNQHPALILERTNLIMSNKFTLIYLNRNLETRRWGEKPGREAVFAMCELSGHRRETEAYEER